MSWDDVGGRFLGKSVPRVDGPDKVTGRARYTFDVRLPGMLEAAVLRCPYAHARATRIDASRARRLPGVKAVRAQQGKTCRYQGEIVAAVAAETIDQARDAIQAIEVQWDVLPAAVREEDAMVDAAPSVFERDPNVRTIQERRQGDPEGELTHADAIVEMTLRTPVQVHACMETHGVVAHVTLDGLTVWASTQGVSATREQIARALDLDPARVRVICEHMGGGFGSKLGAGAAPVIAAKLSSDAGAPVKLMFDRDGEHISTGNRPSSVQHIRAGASRDGRLTAYILDAYGTGGVGGGAGFPAPYIYRVPAFAITQREVRTNAGPAAAMRAPGHPQASFGMESAVDALAEKLGMDPLAFRTLNDPSKVRREQFAIGARAIGWDRRAKTAGAGAGPVKRGIGVAACSWGGGGGKGNTVSVTVHPDGSLEVRAGTQDLGTGTRTVIGAIVGEVFGIEPAKVRVLVGDTGYGEGTGSGGSTTCASVSPAALAAARLARDELIARLSQRWSLDPAILRIAGGDVRVEGPRPRVIPLAKAAALLGAQPVHADSGFVDGYSGGGVAGCQFAQVAVDTVTGKIRVERVVAVQDCGKVIDKLTAESQVIGGVIQGLSYALLEERVMDRVTGRMLNQGFEDYKIAGAIEIPAIDVIVQDMPERGVIGIGEPPVIPTAAAIASAVYNATGVRMTQLPMSPARVIDALMAQGGKVTTF